MYSAFSLGLNKGKPSSLFAPASSLQNGWLLTICHSVISIIEPSHVVSLRLWIQPTFVVLKSLTYIVIRCVFKDCYRSNGKHCIIIGNTHKVRGCSNAMQYGNISNKKRSVMKKLVAFLFASMMIVGVAHGHSGGTDKNGCHAGSEPHHCH